MAGRRVNKPAQQGVGSQLKNRMGFLWAVVLILGFGYLIWRLCYWMLLNNEELRTSAASQQLMDRTLEPERGEIYDSTGSLLATNSVVWTITTAPNQYDESIDLYEVSRDLADILDDGTDPDELYQSLSDTDSQYLLLARQADKDVSEAITEYAATKTKEEDGYDRKALPIYTTQSNRRVYPYGNFLSQVLGFCNSDGEGVYGLEKSYEEELAGVAGRTITERNKYGEEIPNEIETTYAAKDGSDLHLTIDANVQNIVEKYLLNSVEYNQVQNRGAAIVMDVNTGEIKALAIESSFDPNDPYTLSEADNLKLEELEDDAEYTQMQGQLREAQWKNKTITDLYYPGSVFKIITTAAALDSGKATADTTFTCAGSFTVADTAYQCASKAVHGLENMALALRNSCNIYYIQLGQQIGATTFYNYFNAFGFTDPTGIDLPYETQYMQYYSVDNLGPVQLASSSFGQAQKITMMQTATAVAAAVNGGYLVQPHVVEYITDADGNVTEEADTSPKRQVISEEVSKQICEMLDNVVESGKTGAPGRNAYVAGYRVGGKSGTSEKLDDERNEYGGYRFASSFCGVFPIDDPQYLVLVVLDDPNTATDSSLQLSGPCVGNIISEIAPYFGVTVNYTQDELENQVMTVPECIDREWSMAQVELNKKGFIHKTVGSGSTVVYQYPDPYTKLRLGSTVYLYTDNYLGETTTVPDLVGRSLDYASTMLKSAGLNLEAGTNTEGNVVAQSEEPGTEVQKGTVITLQLDTDPVEEPQPET